MKNKNWKIIVLSGSRIQKTQQTHGFTKKSTGQRERERSGFGQIKQQARKISDGVEPPTTQTASSPFIQQDLESNRAEEGLWSDLPRWTAEICPRYQCLSYRATRNKKARLTVNNTTFTHPPKSATLLLFIVSRTSPGSTTRSQSHPRIGLGRRRRR